MNIFRTPRARAFAVALALPLFVLLVGCDVDSVDSTTSVLADNSGTIYNFAGLYMHPDFENASTNGPPPLVYPNGAGNRPSGKLITSLRLLQYGSVLEAYDSESQTWSGSISSLQGETATFSLRGRTTAGLSVEIAGTMVYADQQSTMDASWIEPAYYGTLSAKATVPPSATNSPSNNLSLDSNVASLSISNTATLTASGCSSTYTWECNKNFGSFTSLGNIGYYTRTSGASTDSETISVLCGSDKKSVTIDFNGSSSVSSNAIDSGDNTDTNSPPSPK